MRFGHVPLPVGGRGGERRRSKRTRVMGEEGDRGREGKRRKRQTENQILYACLLRGMLYILNWCVCLSPYLPEDRGHVDLLLTTHNP